MNDGRPTRLAALAFAPFRGRAPWWGADLQTLRNYVRPRARIAAYRETRLTLPMTDGTGDRLAAALNEPQTPTARPLAVLVHGLSGDEASHYMLRTALTLLPLGYRVLRLNLRGAGPSRALSRFQYHAGRTGDFDCALDALPSALKANGIAVVGYSLGGNMLLKYLGERGSAVPVRAAVSVSAPIDLALTSRRMEAWRNLAYHLHLIRQMRQEALTPASEIAPDERRLLARVRTIRAFDEGFTVPRNNFANVDAYYGESSARHYMAGIAVPTLVIHALNDPWVPAAPYLDYPWSRNPSLRPQLVTGGGHVGFHGIASTPWHDLAISQFFEALFSPP
jgi:hypothetical protein